MQRLPLIYNAGILLLLGACSSNDEEKRIQEDLFGEIAYPFAPTKSLGKNQPAEKFVIKTTVGNTEYTVEIPNAGQDYNIELPLASLESSALGGPDRPSGLSKPNITDKELTGALPKLENQSPNETGFLDKAFGVAQKEGASTAPSYTLGMAKVRSFYKQKKFEYALIEANQMLSYYPTSVKLHKMKGSIHFRLNNLDLAEKAWSRALELDPRDKRLQKGLVRLRERRAKVTSQN